MDTLNIPINSYSAVKKRLIEVAEAHLKKNEFDPNSSYKKITTRLLN
jgi:hypothetical protein